MNIIIDISHPAHVHFFKHAYRIWQEHGHKVMLVGRDKDITLQLLDDYGYPYQSLSKKGEGVIGLAKELVHHEGKLFKIARDFHADVMMEIGGTFIVHAGKLLGIKTCVFYDHEPAGLSITITFPFATWIINPTTYKLDLGKKQVRYAGYQELAYLHPNRFKPDPEALQKCGLNIDDKYFILRFVSWGASHDFGKAGFSDNEKIELVRGLIDKGKVLITSEGPLPPELEPYKIRISPTLIHDLLYYASLYVGEGATMASEAAQLGTPSINMNPLQIGYIEELADKYHLIHKFIEGNPAIEKAIQLAGITEVKAEYRARQQKMLADKIDVTAWMVEFVENLGK